MIKYHPSASQRPIELKDFRRQQTIENDAGDPINRQISLATDVSMAWRNLRYEVPAKRFSKERKVILRRLTGQVKYRSLNGFMGPSGAGKTTLLNCLNGNIRGMASGTELYVNEEEKKFPAIGFIEQHVHETIIGGLTVGEVLYYAYRFKNGLSDSVKMKVHIQTILSELLLDPSLLARRFNQCSGGEQKRVAIAQELMSLNKPTFLFVDEPTTGLDSQAALLVMQCLRSMTNNYPITLMLTIHMPNDEIIKMFDQLYILAKGGLCIYAGRREFLRQNLRQQLSIEIEPGRPPIEEYLKIASIGDDNVMKLAEHTLKNENEKLRPYKNKLRYLSSGMPRKFKRFSFSDLLLQMVRMFYVIVVVDFSALFYQVACYVGFFLFMTTVFDHSIINLTTCYPKYNSTISCHQIMEESSTSNNYLFFQAYALLFIDIINLNLGAILLAPFLKVFHNEHQNRWYSMSVFYWSFATIRFLEMTFYSVIITIMFYFPIGHHLIDETFNWTRFGNFWLFFWLSCLYMQSVGQGLSIILKDKMEIAMTMAQILFIALNLLNGYMINLHHMTNPVTFFLSELAATKFITNGLIYTFYGLDRCDLTTHYSLKLETFSVDGERIYSDLKSVYMMILLIRLVGFVVMYIQYSLPGKIAKLKQSVETIDQWEVLPLDPLDPPILKKSSSITNIASLTDLLQRNKDEWELEFEEFSRNKIIVGWRMLTLFSTTSINEIRSAKNIEEDPDLILRDLNGQFRFGTLNALMGTSGAGKTSFLKVLNGRSKTRLSDETQIYLSKYTPIRICFITQEVSGHLWPGLTAKQSLIYASKLKNTFETEPVDHEKIAWALLEELGLLDTANTLAQNCSGGEKKRLALALELTSLRMPNFICIDEPTSGLDSNSANIVLDILRRLTHRHSITIVASIHQPSTEMLMLFDHCYVLARGGVCIYSDHPNHIPQHLLEVPETKWSPETDCFPTEELIKWSSMDYKNPVVKKLSKSTKKKILTNDPILLEETQRVVDGIQMNRVRFSCKSVLYLFGRYLAYTKNYLWIFMLSYIVLDLTYGLVARAFFQPSIAITDGCIDMEEDFLNCNRSKAFIQMEFDLTSNVRYSLFFNCFFLFLVMIQAALFFSKESIYFFNEHRNGWYSTGSFYIMKSAFDLIPMIPITFLYIYIVNIYEVVRPGIYWWFCLLMFLAIIACQGLGHFLALLFLSENHVQTNRQTTMITFTGISVFFILTLMANFFNPIPRMHYVYQMLSNFSLLRWVHEATMILEYGFGRCGFREVQAVLYFMMITNDEHFYLCLQMLCFNLILLRLSSLFLLIKKSNPIENRRKRAQKILQYHKENLTEPIDVILPGLGAPVEFRIRKIDPTLQMNTDNNYLKTIAKSLSKLSLVSNQDKKPESQQHEYKPGDLLSP